MLTLPETTTCLRKSNFPPELHQRVTHHCDVTAVDNIGAGAVQAPIARRGLGDAIGVERGQPLNSRILRFAQHARAEKVPMLRAYALPDSVTLSGE
jgi:hypothetical protein